MTKPTLTPAMRRVLERTDGKEWRSAYQLQARLQTLQALRYRGFVSVGGFTNPKAVGMAAFVLKWKRTPKGRKALERT